MMRKDRHDLIGGLILIVAADRKIYTKAMGAMVSSGSGKIDRKISSGAGPPVEPRVQRRLFEIAIENQIGFFIRLIPFDNSQAFKILPDVHSLFDSARGDQTLEVRRGGREGKRARVRYHQSPNSIGGVVIPLIAQKIHVANFELLIRTISQHFLEDRVGLLHSLQRRPSGRRKRG